MNERSRKVLEQSLLIGGIICKLMMISFQASIHMAFYIVIQFICKHQNYIYNSILNFKPMYFFQNCGMYWKNINNTVAKGFNKMAPPARTITVALDMSKAFDTINIHTLIRKLLQTKIPGTIIKFIANYIKGRKAYTTYRNHTSSQRQFKTSIPQGGVFHQHYSTFTLHTYTTTQCTGSGHGLRR